MNWLKAKRIRQVILSAWKDSVVVAKETKRSRFAEYISLLRCFSRYYVFSNQYVKNRFWELDKSTFAEKAEEIGGKNRKHDDWVVDSYRNRKFFNKYSTVWWETTPARRFRCRKAYARQFNADEGLIVQRNVDIHREHYLEGTIKIGKNVLLAKNVFIDYSGHVEIRDNVKISNGAIIESHRHVFEPGADKYKAVQTNIVIEDGAWIGQGAIICEECKRIGRYAQIGAGAVVRNPVPPYAIMVGNPAKVVGFLLAPEEVKVFENERFSDAPTNMDKYEKDYQRLFIERIKEIKNQLKN